MSVQVKQQTKKGTKMIYNHGPVKRLYHGAAEMDANDPLHKKYMKEWYFLDPAPGSSWIHSGYCAHHVLGKRCPKSKKINGYCGIVYPHLWDIWDHCRAWRAENGNRVITLEPWGSPILDAEKIRALQDSLKDIGIDMGFEGRAPYGSSYILFLADHESSFGWKMRTFSQSKSRVDSRDVA